MEIVIEQMTLNDKLNPDDPVADGVLVQHVTVTRRNVPKDTSKKSYGFKARYIAAAVIIAIAALSYGVKPANAAEVQETTYHHWSAADFNMDGKVDLKDLAWLTAAYQTPGSISTESTIGTDADGNGIVGIEDVLTLADEWLRDAEVEFGPDYGKIVVGLLKTYETNGDFKRSDVTVINKSNYPDPGLYQIDNIVAGVGTNQGITGFSQISNWLYDYLTDPDMITQETTVPGHMIKAPGAVGDDRKTFILQADLQNGQDPAKLIYEIRPIDAGTDAGYQGNTVMVPLPVNNNQLCLINLVS